MVMSILIMVFAHATLLLAGIGVLTALRGKRVTI
jgi:hypothetical protein